jgi:hypothetical protein
MAGRWNPISWNIANGLKVEYSSLSTSYISPFGSIWTKSIQIENIESIFYDKKLYWPMKVVINCPLATTAERTLRQNASIHQAMYDKTESTSTWQIEYTLQQSKDVTGDDIRRQRGNHLYRQENCIYS